MTGTFLFCISCQLLSWELVMKFNNSCQDDGCCQLQLELRWGRVQHSWEHFLLSEIAQHPGHRFILQHINLLRRWIFFCSRPAVSLSFWVAAKNTTMNIKRNLFLSRPIFNFYTSSILFVLSQSSVENLEIILRSNQLLDVLTKWPQGPWYYCTPIDLN